MTLRSVRAMGTHTAAATKDAKALPPDGQTHVLINDLGDHPEDAKVVDTLFEDGVWTLATSADLVEAVGGRTRAN